MMVFVLLAEDRFGYQERYIEKLGRNYDELYNV